MQVLQPKPLSLVAKKFELHETRCIPRNMDVAREFEVYQIVTARKAELEEEYEACMHLDIGALLMETHRQEAVQRWLFVALEEEMWTEWAALLVYGSSLCERAEVLEATKDHGMVSVMETLAYSGPGVCCLSKVYDLSQNKYLAWYLSLVSTGNEFWSRKAGIMHLEVDKSLSSYEPVLDWEWIGNCSFVDQQVQFMYEHDWQGFSGCFQCEKECEACNSDEGEVRVSANAVVGGGLRKKNLSPKQLEGKILRNAARKEMFEASLCKRDHGRKARSAFVDFVNEDSNLCERLAGDPIKCAHEPRKNTDDWQYDLQQKDLFVEEKGCVVGSKQARTHMNMNALCGYQIVPEQDAAFRKFVQGRDKRVAAKRAQEKQQAVQAEWDHPCRHEERLEELFEAVACAFEELLSAGDGFAFKYCPTPACSADKATGTCARGGIAYAVMKRMGFPGVGLDDVSFLLFLIWRGNI